MILMEEWDKEYDIWWGCLSQGSVGLGKLGEVRVGLCRMEKGKSTRQVDLLTFS